MAALTEASRRKRAKRDCSRRWQLLATDWCCPEEREQRGGKRLGLGFVIRVWVEIERDLGSVSDCGHSQLTERRER